jgi:hypothetical protein
MIHDLLVDFTFLEKRTINLNNHIILSNQLLSMTKAISWQKLNIFAMDSF